MRHPRNLQRSFAGGEVAPQMFSRVDDPKVQNGAALLQNFVARPQGSALRRPGCRRVRAVKSDAYRSVLFPFVFSPEQSVVLEFSGPSSESSAPARPVGHMRIHDDGGTLLYSRPENYIGRTPVSVVGPTYTATGHGLTTGDPVVLTAWPDTSRSITNWSDDEDIDSSPSTTPTAGQTLVMATTNAAIASSLVATSSTTWTEADEPQAIVFRPDSGASLPDELEAGRVYWIVEARENTAGNLWHYRISETRGGAPIVSEAGSAGSGTIYFSALPQGPVGQPIVPNRTYYAFVVSANTFELHETRAESLAAAASGGINAQRNGIGTGRTMHYGYRQGDLTRRAGNNYYCIRAPWCSAPVPDDFNYCFEDDDGGHDPLSFADTSASNDAYVWYQLPGAAIESGSVTVDFANDRIDIGAHSFADGDLVVLDGTTAPSGLSFGEVYYVRNPGATTIQLSSDPLVPDVLPIGSAGSAVAVSVNQIYEVPHFYSDDELDRITTAQSNDVITIASADRPAAELRRESATRWVLRDIEFQSPAVSPDGVSVSTFGGEGEYIDGISGNGFRTQAIHSFLVGDVIQMDNITENTTGSGFANSAGISGMYGSGQYVISRVAAVTAGGAPAMTPAGSEVNAFEVRRLESGEALQPTGGAFPAIDDPIAVRARFVGSPDSQFNDYVVTAISELGEESASSAEVRADNNLSVSAAVNTLSWNASANATRYRVYKKINGLFGFIGETEETTFQDDNITPDTSIAPPDLDPSLRAFAQVTFDAANEYVLWPGHQVLEGSPVTFRTTAADGMPGNFAIEGRSYYALNVEDGRFQLATSPSSADPVPLSAPGTGAVVFAFSGLFPGAVGYAQGRRVFCGSLARPQDVWMTGSGFESDLSFSIPTVDSDRIYFRLLVRESAAVRHVVPLQQLVLLTTTSEVRVTPVNSDILTPTSVGQRPQSYVGADYPQPAIINNVVVFAANRGGHIREMGYNRDVESYLTGDLSIRATHLFDNLTIQKIAYQKAPIPTVWCLSSDGKLLSLTYLPEENVGAWCRHTTDGTFESVAIVPEGTEDAVYVTVNRNGSRSVERMDDLFTGQLAPAKTIADAVYLDSSLTYSGAARTTFTGLQHLANQTVAYLADGIQGTATVSATGTLTLPTAASKVTFGETYTSEINSVPMHTAGVPAFGSGATKNITRVFVRVYESGAFELGQLGGKAPKKTRTPATGVLQTELQEELVSGSWDLEGQVVIRQSDALPLTVVGMTIEMASGN